MDNSQSKVLYMVGPGRSGGTLLTKLLVQSPQICAVGELARIWTTGFINNEFCTCGQPLSECEFWTAGVGPCAEWKRPRLHQMHTCAKSCIR